MYVIILSYKLIGSYVCYNFIIKAHEIMCDIILSYELNRSCML